MQCTSRYSTLEVNRCRQSSTSFALSIWFAETLRLWQSHIGRQFHQLKRAVDLVLFQMHFV